MKRIGVLGFSLLAIVMAAMTLAFPLYAQGSHEKLIPFTAVLTGGQEVPANDSNAFGVAFMTFDETTDMLNFSLTYTDEKLTGTEVAAHFHAPAIPGVAAPVVFGLVNPGVFNLGSPKVGSVGPFSEQQKRDLMEGLFYINVHTTAFPGGEIRGQVLPVGDGFEFDIEDEEDEG